MNDEIRDYIEQVKAEDQTGDYEGAHRVEDDLLWTFVEQRATAGDVDAQAIVALRNDENRGFRWYA